ncbi:uncharacterized protein [Blastocystis hominis]|uniref:MI domain-containing protein n=1 Tax=Blastocystis hominis TaxID=12968 RepID=D8LZQ1_BLAHO|nr:uncharacterized protein [Blastocystis hominis]CBK21290.2 unnamed protein product [Blastocystis hominis]|eukprot:XP_012895338.1 uncharacterized protein [Blastocystis hominis]
MTPEIINSRAGGVYIPPFKLARLSQNLDKSSPEYQRQTWEALRKSLNGIINKVNVVNIGNIIPELFQENLVRGRGLFCRALMKAQLTSPGFTHVYAALIAIVNTKLPEVGELLLKRVVFQFRRAFRRNDKLVAVSLSRFIAHLVNQRVSDPLLVLQLIFLLLQKPTNDSVEIAVNVTKECGQCLQEDIPQALNEVFETFRRILHEGLIEKRTQYVIEQLFAVRRTEFEEYPRMAPELDLVEDGDQITHTIELNKEIDKEEHLDVFHVDPNFVENEETWKKIKMAILGEDETSSEDEDDDDEDDNEDDNEDEDEDEDEAAKEKKVLIEDQTDQDTTNLRRTIYLVITSSLGFEECTHKLLKINLREGQEIEVCNMIVETCNRDTWMNQFYPNVAQRLCMLDKKWQDAFCRCFIDQFEKIHQLATLRIKINAMFFAYLFAVDCLPWEILGIVRLTENDTTSSSRIFLKELLQKMSNQLGLKEMNARFQSEELKPQLTGLFPTENSNDVRFAINFYTSIGLGGLTKELRETWEKLRAGSKKK